MRMHIEYDDFGEYVECLEDLQEPEKKNSLEGSVRVMKRFAQKLTFVVACAYFTAYPGL